MLFCQKERQKFCWNVISKVRGLMYSKHLEHYIMQTALTMCIVVSKLVKNEGKFIDSPSPSEHLLCGCAVTEDRVLTSLFLST